MKGTHGVWGVVERVERKVRQNLEEALLRGCGASAASGTLALACTRWVEGCVFGFVRKCARVSRVLALTQSPQRLFDDAIGRLGQVREDAKRKRENVPHELTLRRDPFIGRRVRRRHA